MNYLNRINYCGQFLKKFSDGTHKYAYCSLENSPAEKFKLSTLPQDTSCIPRVLHTREGIQNDNPKMAASLLPSYQSILSISTDLLRWLNFRTPIVKNLGARSKNWVIEVKT